MAESYRTINPAANAIRAPIGHRVGHSLHARAVQRLTVKIIDACNPAHGSSETKHCGKAPGHRRAITLQRFAGPDSGASMQEPFWDVILQFAKTPIPFRE
jgi:hypothetical protein